MRQLDKTRPCVSWTRRAHARVGQDAPMRELDTTRPCVVGCDLLFHFSLFFRAFGFSPPRCALSSIQHEFSMHHSSSSSSIRVFHSSRVGDIVLFSSNFLFIFRVLVFEFFHSSCIGDNVLVFFLSKTFVLIHRVDGLNR